LTEKEISIQKEKEGIENGRKEIVTSVLLYYKNKSFDELIKSSTKQSIKKIG